MGYLNCWVLDYVLQGPRFKYKWSHGVMFSWQVERVISSIDLHSSASIKRSFFALPNGFNLSLNDQHVLHHLLPQSKIFTVEISDFNSCFRCWGHVLLEVRFIDLIFSFSCRDPLLSVFFSFFIVVGQQGRSDTTCNWYVCICGRMYGCEDLQGKSCTTNNTDVRQKERR